MGIEDTNCCIFASGFFACSKCFHEGKDNVSYSQTHGAYTPKLKYFNNSMG